MIGPLIVRFPSGTPSQAQPQLRLLCLGHAGSGVAPFHRWSKLLPPEIDVLAVQLPAREKRWREAPFTRMDTLVSALASEVEELLDRPLAMFGHSFGAMIAFALTGTLARRDLPLPMRLFLSGRQAVTEPQTEPQLHTLPDNLFVDAVTRRFEGIPNAIRHDPELMSIFVRALRADFEVIETYVYPASGALPVPFTVLGGRDDPQMQAERIAGWSRLTTFPAQVELFEGGHFYLAEQLPAVLDLIMGHLALSRPFHSREAGP